MDQMLSLFCACMKQVMDKDGDGIPDFMQTHIGKKQLHHLKTTTDN